MQGIIHIGFVKRDGAVGSPRPPVAVGWQGVLNRGTSEVTGPVRKVKAMVLGAVVIGEGVRVVHFGIIVRLISPLEGGPSL